MVIGGSNDVSKNQASEATSALKRTLANLTHTNSIIVNLPHRHDLNDTSPVHKEITKTNCKYKQICDHFNNVTLINVGTFKRDQFTKHGQHFNYSGKMALCQALNEVLHDKFKSQKTIIQGNLQ